MNKLERIQKYFDKEGDDYDRYFHKKRLSFKSIGRFVGSIYGGKAVDGRMNAVVALCGNDIAGKKILEAGCGPGHYSIRLAKQGAKMVGIDFAPKMINIAKSRAKEADLGDDCQFITGNFMNHDFGDEKFEISFATGVFDYIPPEIRTDFLEKMKNLSTEFVIASFPKKYSLHALLRKIWLYSKNIPVYFYSQSDIDTLFMSAGLKEVSHCDVGVLVVKKATKK